VQEKTKQKHQWNQSTLARLEAKIALEVSLFLASEMDIVCSVMSNLFPIN
jgi:hypothetical protein